MRTGLIGDGNSDCLSEGKDVLSLDCKSCGTSFPAGTKFCSICGEAFPDSPSEVVKSEGQSSEPAASGSKSTSPIMLIGLAVIGAFILYVMLKG